VQKLQEENFSLIQIFRSRAERYRSRTALQYKDPRQKKYRPISWAQWALTVRAVTLGLRQLGVEYQDRIGILSENRPEWTYADLGALGLGAISVPIYPTSSPQDVHYILTNAGIEILFVSSPEQFARIREQVDQNTGLKRVILFDEAPVSHPKLIPLSKLLEMGRLHDMNDASLYARLAEIAKPEDIATLIYTSGTTGPPKGVMLTHRNFIANYLGASQKIPIGETDIALSFLPLSHVFERLAGYYYMVFHGATIAYAENMQTVADDMRIVRPTVAAAVPRFYEKVYARIMEKVQAGTPLRKKIFYWALGVGGRYAKAAAEKNAMPPGLRFSHWIANKLVFQKVRQGLGGRLRFFISGGAPLSKELAEFFYAAGVLILEGYGLTETSPVIAVNSLTERRFGTVGKVLPNVEVKIAEDGEILTRGACVMRGYYQNEAATAEVMKDGWFHTGDIGLLDGDGFLKITDRKKDIIATSGGKKVSPQNIEGLILADKLFAQVVVLGDKKNYLVALVVPNRLMVEEFARTEGIPSGSYEALLENSAVVGWMEKRLKQRIQGLASYEQIKYFALIAQEFSQEAGELTPTLKVKRKVIMDKYRDIIEKLYAVKAPGESASRASASAG
jgi:long-chain acyl-CoA synthetase